MIFFISDFVGRELILFIIKKFKKDIKIVVVDTKDKLTIAFLKKNLQKSKIIIWDNNNNSKAIKELEKIKPEKIFLLWWPYILNKRILIIPKYETINIHPSYLPFYKGKDPNFWALINNGPYGVSIHKVTSKIDSGDILFRKKITNIDFSYDAKKLYELNKKKIIILFKNSYKILRKNEITKGIPNKIVGRTNKRKNMIKKAKLDLKKYYKGENIINLLRAKNFKPHEGIIFKKNKKEFSININIKLIKSNKY